MADGAFGGKRVSTIESLEYAKADMATLGRRYSARRGREGTARSTNISTNIRKKLRMSEPPMKHVPLQNMFMPSVYATSAPAFAPTQSAPPPSTSTSARASMLPLYLYKRKAAETANVIASNAAV